LERKVVSEMMLTLLLIGMLTFAFNIQRVKAQNPDFRIIDAKRAYSVEDGTGTDGQRYWNWGYWYNIIIENIGTNASKVGVSIYTDFCENGTKGSTAYHYDWKSGEMKSQGWGFGWPNKTVMPLNKWVKIVINSTVIQTFFIYFEALLTISAHPKEMCHLEETKVNGRLLNTTNGIGIPNQNLSTYIDGIYELDTITDSNGNYSFGWIPETTGYHTISVVWDYGGYDPVSETSNFAEGKHEVVVEAGPVGGIYIPVNKLELLAPYIGLTILLALAIITVAYVKKRKRNTQIIS